MDLPKSDRLFRAFIKGNAVSPAAEIVEGAVCPKVRFHAIPEDIIRRAIKNQMLGTVWEAIVGTAQSPCADLIYNAKTECYLVAVTGEHVSPINPADEPSVRECSVQTLGIRIARLLGYPDPPKSSAQQFYDATTRGFDKLVAVFTFQEAESNFIRTLERIDQVA